MYKITRLLGFCIVYLLVVVLQAKAEQDYFRLRNNPDLQILLDNKQVLVDLKSIHTQLALKANEVRTSFEKEGIFENLEKILIWKVKSDNVILYIESKKFFDVRNLESFYI